MKQREAVKLIERTARWRWTNWLLSLRNRDLRSLTRDEWKILQREIIEFCELGPVSSFRIVAKLLPPVPYVFLERGRSQKISLSRRQVEEWQSALRQVLDDLFPLTGDGRWTIPAPIVRTQLQRTDGSMVDSRGKETPISWVSRTDSARWPDIFWWRVAEMLQTFGSVTRRCLHCQTLFLRIKRQAYCSKQCSGNARAKRWYEAHKEEAKERRHLFYVKQVQKEHPKARVQRRNKP